MRVEPVPSKALPNGPSVRRSGAAKVTLLSIWAVWGVLEGVYDGLGRATPEYLPGLLALAMFFAVYLWLIAERGRHPSVAAQYGGFGFFVFWPLFLPIYLVQTRGWRRAIARLIAVILLLPAGLVAGGVAARLLS